MCTETGIKDVYQGVQGACPRRAVTHAGGTAERSERRAIGMGLKLISSLIEIDIQWLCKSLAPHKWFYILSNFQGIITIYIW